MIMADGWEFVLIWALAIAVVPIVIIWIVEHRAPKVTFDEPYGDATETDRVIHNAKRINNARAK